MMLSHPTARPNPLPSRISIWPFNPLISTGANVRWQSIPRIRISLTASRPPPKASVVGRSIMGLPLCPGKASISIRKSSLRPSNQGCTCANTPHRTTGQSLFTPLIDCPAGNPMVSISFPSHTSLSCISSFLIPILSGIHLQSSFSRSMSLLSTPVAATSHPAFSLSCSRLGCRTHQWPGYLTALLLPFSVLLNLTPTSPVILASSASSSTCAHVTTLPLCCQYPSSTTVSSIPMTKPVPTSTSPPLVNVLITTAPLSMFRSSIATVLFSCSALLLSRRTITTQLVQPCPSPGSRDTPGRAARIWPHNPILALAFRDALNALRALLPGRSPTTWDLRGFSRRFDSYDRLGAEMRVKLRW